MSTPLPGREAVLRVLDEVLDSAAAGTARGVLVHGEPGSGRSALLEAVEAAAADRFLILRASGHPAESELPYAGLHQLLQPLLQELPTEDLPRRLAQALGLSDAAEPKSGGTALGQELLMLIATASERRPVLVLVDDAQWLDDSSRTMLVFLARRLDDDAVAMVVATEQGPPAYWTGIGEELELTPLDRTAARTLLRAHHPELGGATMDWLHGQTGGVPLLLLEAADRLTPDQRAGREPLPAVLTGEWRMAGPLADRLTSLPGDTLEALLVVALDDLDDAELARALARRGLNRDHLDAAERAGLVRLESGRCRFTSASARWWVRAHSTDADRRAAHEALADALAHPGSRGAGTVIRRALHQHQASVGPDREVAAALAEAAAEAGRRGGFAEAGRLWHLATDHAVTAAEVRNARLSAVEHYFRGGVGDPALVLLDALVAEATDETERARWHAMRVLLSSWRKVDLVAEHDELVRLARQLLGADPDAAAAGGRLVIAMSLAHLAAGRCRTARQALDLLGPAEALTGLPRVLAASLGAEAGHTEPASGLVHAWLAELGDGDLDEATVSSIGLLADVQWPDAVQVCELMWRRCVELTGPTTPQPLATILVRYLRARLDQARGEWDAAVRELAEVSTLARDAGFDGAHPFITLRRAMLLARRGDVATSTQLRRAVLAGGDPTLGVEHLAACVEAVELATTGEYSAALGALAHAAELEHRGGWTVLGEGTRTAEEVEILCRLGRLAEAQALAEGYAVQARRSAHPADLALAARCLGLVAPAEEIDEHFEGSLARLRELRRPFEVARTLFTWGQRLRRARRKADAIPRLEEADRIFAGLGAHGWQDAAGAELAACGRRRSVEPPPGSVLRSLTPREFAVVREVAGGATNAEAAARLFISPRTVEQHLSRAYRKLEIPDRAALTRLIGQAYSAHP